MHNLHSNNFVILDEQLFGIAEGCFPLGSLLNHSCDPNCLILYSGKMQVVRACRDVSVGQELTQSYLDPLLPKSERQKRLQAKYRFDCICNRCLGMEIAGNGFSLFDGIFDSPIPESLFDSMARTLIQPPRSIFKESLSTPRSSTVLKALLKTESWYQTHFDLLKTTNEINRSVFSKAVEIQDNALALQDVGKALPASLYILSVYCLGYVRSHPLLAHQATLCAQIAWNYAGQIELQQAKEIVSDCVALLVLARQSYSICLPDSKCLEVIDHLESCIRKEWGSL